MNSKNLTIIPPEGMEAYQEGDKIKFRPIKEKKPSYKDIARKLLYGQTVWYINNWGKITSLIAGDCYYHPNNCTSIKQAEKLLAINKLMNVAKYLNGDWQPNWNNSKECKYCLIIEGNDITICCRTETNSNIVYFETKELAQRAVEILGEETIKLALSTNW